MPFPRPRAVSELLLFHFYQTGRWTFPAFSPYGRELSISMHPAHTASSFFSLFLFPLLTHSLSSTSRLGGVFFACVELQKSKKVTKFCASFELFPFNLETKPRGDRVAARLAPAASPVTNCVKQHHSATRRAD